MGDLRDVSMSTSGIDAESARYVLILRCDLV